MRKGMPMTCDYRILTGMLVGLMLAVPELQDARLRLTDDGQGMTKQATWIARTAYD